MTSAPLFKRVLILGGIFAAIIAIVGSVIGYLIAGSSGVLSAVVGASSSALFLGLTAASILVAGKVTKSNDNVGAFFGIVTGTWIVKLVLFIVVALWLRSQDWLEPMIFFVTVLIAVVGTLIIDVLAVQFTRTPYVDVALPGKSEDSMEKSASDS
ncbi:MAG: hypothetical protein ABIW81_03520 [Terrimesophilobacter sp.]